MNQITIFETRAKAHKFKNMKKGLLLLFFGALLSSSVMSQDCFSRLQKAFDDRGAQPVIDEMHRNVIISYFEDGSSFCVSGKVRVENGTIVSIFLQYDDGNYDLMDSKFHNLNNTAPLIINGISEMIITEDKEKLRVIFIDTLKPKKKGYKEVVLPDDL